MQLTLHSDYSLRALLYLAENPGRFVPTVEISEAYGISRHHLVRVMETLHEGGFVTVATGCKGGSMLAHAPADINLAHVVRATEPGFRIVECFDGATNTCRIVSDCQLKGALHEALDAFFASLSRYTLADVARSGAGLIQIAELARA